MRNSIVVIIVNDFHGFVGVKRGDIHDESGEYLCDIAQIHEFGTITVDWIPARPFILPVLEKFKDEAMKLFEKTFYEQMGLKQ